MKTIKNRGIVLFMALCAVPLGYTQEQKPDSPFRAKDENIPLHLRPSTYAIEQGKEMGGEVFKLISVDDAYDRGSSFGAYFSFSDRWYGTADQFRVFRGEFRVGDAWSYGFFADLGQIDLRKVDRTSREAAYFLSYKPPKLDPDIRSEVKRLTNIKVDRVSLTRRAAVRPGHTYLLRSIDYIFRTDKVVVLNVLETSHDGTITIVWKMLAELERPIRLFMSDAELRGKVQAVVAELGIQGITFTVANNFITFVGPETNFSRVTAALGERQIPYCGIIYGSRSTYRRC